MAKREIYTECFFRGLTSLRKVRLSRILEIHTNKHFVDSEFFFAEYSVEDELWHFYNKGGVHYIDDKSLKQIGKQISLEV